MRGPLPRRALRRPRRAGRARARRPRARGRLRARARRPPRWPSAGSTSSASSSAPGWPRSPGATWRATRACGSSRRAFESWQHDGAPFAAVAAFSSFHWVDPDVRYAKAASLLRPDGALALAGSLHVLPADGDPFFAEVQADYDAVRRARTTGRRPIRATSPTSAARSRRPGTSAYVAHRRCARRARVHRRRVHRPAARRSRVTARSTPERRGELHARIRRRIEARPGGRVRKSSLALLNVARRL